jgi:hypothetical protein
MIDTGSHLHHIDGEFDIHVALDPAAALGIGEFLQRLGHHREAVIIQPVHQRPQGREFLVFGDGRVIKGAHQRALAGKELQKPLIVDVESQPLGRAIEIGAVNEESQFFRRIEKHYVLQYPV